MVAAADVGRGSAIGIGQDREVQQVVGPGVQIVEIVGGDVVGIQVDAELRVVVDRIAQECIAGRGHRRQRDARPVVVCDEIAFTRRRPTNKGARRCTEQIDPTGAIRDRGRPGEIGTNQVALDEVAVAGVDIDSIVYIARDQVGGASRRTTDRVVVRRIAHRDAGPVAQAHGAGGVHADVVAGDRGEVGAAFKEDAFVQVAGDDIAIGGGGPADDRAGADGIDALQGVGPRSHW
ncbi:MAG: hypothetical protein R3E48_13360 [Burkholderiaceae bacterium]